MDREVRKYGKVIESLLLTSTEVTTKLVRCIKDLEDITRENDELRETVGEHIAWAGERSKSIDANHLAVVDRLGRLEGRVFNGRKD